MINRHIINIIHKKSEHKEYLIKLPKIPQKFKYFKILYNPKEFFSHLLYYINQAKNNIYIVTLYLEQDSGGRKILEALFQVKKIQPKLQIKILVDWHRAKRNRIGTKSIQTNSDWYYKIAKIYNNIEIPIYGVPIHTNEILGVLHLKGFIIDDLIIYSGASLNNTYLNQTNKCRFDRYHLIRNKLLSETMLNYINTNLTNELFVYRLDKPKNTKIITKKNTKLFRKSLRISHYNYKNITRVKKLSITPLVGLGKNNILNKTIHHLICATEKKMTICTPYFNIPNLLFQDFTYLLNKGKIIEIITGDKTTNDFFISINKPFKIINTLPYLYEINLRNFLKKLQYYIDNKQLIIRIWKNKNNGYHLKGLWIDKEWQLITGNNFNIRAWKLDLENALLIHDPQKILHNVFNHELSLIYSNTKILTHYKILQTIKDYPPKIKKIIFGLHHTKFNLFINKFL